MKVSVPPGTHAHHPNHTTPTTALQSGMRSASRLRVFHWRSGLSRPRRESTRA